MGCLCHNLGVETTLRDRRILVVGACGAVMALIGFWISSLSHTALVISHSVPACRGSRGAPCAYVPFPYWATTWPSTPWMVVICVVLFGIWIAASKWLLQQLVSRETP